MSIVCIDMAEGDGIEEVEVVKIKLAFALQIYSQFKTSENQQCTRVDKIELHYILG